MSFHLYVLFHVQGLPVNALKKGVDKVLIIRYRKRVSRRLVLHLPHEAIRVYLHHGRSLATANEIGYC